MSEEAGLINEYHCQECGGFIVTINRDAGTTPFMIRCRATRDCDGSMYSHFYRVDQAQAPEFEWYRPTHAGERKKIRACDQDHIRLGGLLLRVLISPRLA